MNNLVARFFSLVLRLLLLAAGLVFAAGVAVVAAALGAVLMLASGWSRLTGKPGFVRGVRMPRRGTSAKPVETPPMRGGASIARRSRDDVIDVVARETS
jgi:hypothetical protein